MNLLVSPLWSKPVQNSIRIMYACVSFETVMVVEPAVRYNVDEIHLFHYVRDPSQSDNVYSEFYDEVVSRLRASSIRVSMQCRRHISGTWSSQQKVVLGRPQGF